MASGLQLDPLPIWRDLESLLDGVGLSMHQWKQQRTSLCDTRVLAVMREAWAQSGFLLPSLCFSSVIWEQESTPSSENTIDNTCPISWKVTYNHGEQGGVREGPCCRLQKGILCAAWVHPENSRHGEKSDFKNSQDHTCGKSNEHAPLGSPLGTGCL